MPVYILPASPVTDKLCQDFEALIRKAEALSAEYGAAGFETKFTLGQAVFKGLRFEVPPLGWVGDGIGGYWPPRRSQEEIDYLAKIAAISPVDVYPVKQILGLSIFDTFEVIGIVNSGRLAVMTAKLLPNLQENRCD